MVYIALMMQDKSDCRRFYMLKDHIKTTAGRGLQACLASRFLYFAAQYHSEKHKASAIKVLDNSRLPDGSLVVVSLSPHRNSFRDYTNIPQAKTFP